MVSLQALLDDLSDETTTLESILNDLRPAQWSLATPAEGWSIGDQVTHLAYFDEAATLAAMDEDGFRRQAGDLGSRGPDFSAWVADQYRSMDWRDQHEWFRRARTRLIATFEPLDVKAAIPWYGPPMSRVQLRQRSPDGDLGARPGRRRCLSNRVSAIAAPAPHRSSGGQDHRILISRPRRGGARCSRQSGS